MNALAILYVNEHLQEILDDAAEQRRAHIDRPSLIDPADLERSLSDDHGPLDEGLATWAIHTVSAVALDLTGQSWETTLDVPAAAAAVMGLAARRLYTNPDRYTRVAEGDSSLGYDASVTGADVFTPSEVATLQRHRRTRRARPTGLGTVSTTRGDDRLSDETVPSQGGEPFPWYRDGYPYGWV